MKHVRDADVYTLVGSFLEQCGFMVGAFGKRVK